MWDRSYLTDILKMFLPPKSRIIVLNTPTRPAVDMVDIDGDEILELIGAYRWQGENYLMILKYYCSAWYVIDIKKGSGNIATFFDLKPRVDKMCQHISLPDKDGIDFSSIKYICSEKEKDMKLEKALVKELDLGQYKDSVRYYYNKVDLDEDDPEVFVYLVGFPVCGTGGCNAVIFKQENGEYNVLSRFSLVNHPVIISSSKTKGFRDIIMYVAGGGIESFYAIIKYNGSTYPSNPSIQPKVEPRTKVDGIALVADDITKNPGIKLGN